MENPFLGLKKFSTNTLAYMSHIQPGSRWISLHETVLVLRSSLRELKVFSKHEGVSAKLRLENDSSKKKKKKTKKPLNMRHHIKAVIENKTAVAFFTWTESRFNWKG